MKASIAPSSLLATGSGVPALAAALRYLSYGWSVLPLRPHDKQPLVSWEPLQKARPTEAEVADWYRQWPDANLGIVTGEISKLVVLDVDPKHGGKDTLERLQQRLGTLPMTVEAQTGGAGQHLYFRHPGYTLRNRIGIGQGIDLRGDGGYVVAPPSIHPSGGHYQWAAGRSPVDLALTSLPKWLLTAAGISHFTRSVGDWRHVVREGVPEEQRNSMTAALAGHLLWHGVDPHVALELIQAWNQTRCRPPLDESELVHIVRDIARLHDVGLREALSNMQQLT